MTRGAQWAVPARWPSLRVTYGLCYGDMVPPASITKFGTSLKNCGVKIFRSRPDALAGRAIAPAFLCFSTIYGSFL